MLLQILLLHAWIFLTSVNNLSYSDSFVNNLSNVLFVLYF